MFFHHRVLPYLFQSPFNNIYSGKKKTDMLYVGLGMFSYGGIQAFSAPVVTFLGSKVTGFGIIVLVSGLMLSVFTFVLAYFHDSIAAVVVLLAIIGGSCSGCNVSICSMVLDYTTPEEYGSISGSITLFQTLGSAIGSVAANQIRLSKYVMMDGMKVATDEGYEITLTVMGAILALTFFLSFLYPNKFQVCMKKKQNKEEVDLMDSTTATASASTTPQVEIGISSSSNAATPNVEERKDKKKDEGASPSIEVKVDVGDKKESDNSSSSSSSSTITSTTSSSLSSSSSSSMSEASEEKIKKW